MTPDRRDTRHRHAVAVTLVQRFGWTLKLNVHLHMVFVDGVSTRRGRSTSIAACRCKRGRDTACPERRVVRPSLIRTPAAPNARAELLEAVQHFAAPYDTVAPDFGPGIATTAMPAATAALTPSRRILESKALRRPGAEPAKPPRGKTSGAGLPLATPRSSTETTQSNNANQSRWRRTFRS